MIYGYVRVSTDMQETSSDAQAALLRAHAEKLGTELAAVFVDQDVSGSVPLKDRPAGKRMWDRLAPGDTVVITTKDRAFRSLVDAATTVLQWREKGVKLQILDFPVDLSTDEGEMVFLQGAVFSQYERKQIGKRIRVAIAHRKATGQPYASTRPWGWIRKDKQWVECPAERKLGQHMLRLRKEGLSFSEIAVACVNYRKPFVRKKASPYYHVSDVRSLCRAAEAGYPKRSQESWLMRAPAPTQPAG